jgi:hypothetical protein
MGVTSLFATIWSPNSTFMKTIFTMEVRVAAEVMRSLHWVLGATGYPAPFL